MYCMFNNIYYNFKFFYILNKNFIKMFKLKNINFNYFIFGLNNLFIKKNLILNNNNNFLVKINNKKYLYKYDILNNKLLKNINSLLFSFFGYKNNFLIIDYNIKMLLPFYNNIFGIKNIYLNKNFFFIKRNFLTLNNWLYVYSSFLKKNKISFLFFLDYSYYSKFFNIFNKLDLPLISVITNNIKNIYIDFYININYFNLNFIKIVMYNYIVSIFYKNYNYIQYNYKINFYRNLLKLNNK